MAYLHPQYRSDSIQGTDYIAIQMQQKLKI